MFNTKTRTRTGAPALASSATVHALIVVAFWSSPVVKRSFSVVPIVHAVQSRTVWLPSTAVRPTEGNRIGPIGHAAPTATPNFESTLARSMPAPNDEPTFRGIDEALAPELNAISERLSGSGLAGITIAHVDGPELALPSMAEPPAPVAVVEPPAPPAVRIGGRVEPGRILKQSRPPYPHLARQARVEGIVIVEVTVGATGKIEAVTVIEGHPLLNAAVVESVRHWKYQPAMLNGAPIESKFNIRVNFKLNFG